LLGVIPASTKVFHCSCTPNPSHGPVSTNHIPHHLGARSLPVFVVAIKYLDFRLRSRMNNPPPETPPLCLFDQRLLLAFEAEKLFLKAHWMLLAKNLPVGKLHQQRRQAG
jgi:hypothetical protein